MSNIDFPPLPWPDIEAWLEVSSAEEIASGIHAYARAAVEAEREACAKVAIGEKVDADATGDPSDAAYNVACEHIAAAIRERGKS